MSQVKENITQPFLEAIIADKSHFLATENFLRGAFAPDLLNRNNMIGLTGINRFATNMTIGHVFSFL
jgi:hypothetical protein